MTEVSGDRLATKSFAGAAKGARLTVVIGLFFKPRSALIPESQKDGVQAGGGVGVGLVV